MTWHTRNSAPTEIHDEKHDWIATAATEEIARRIVAMAEAMTQERATASAVRLALRMAVEQIEFLHGSRKRAWDGDFLKRIYTAGLEHRSGCLFCNGTGMVYGPPVDIALPGAPEPCPDCDPSAPGFAPVLTSIDGTEGGQ